MFRRVAHLSLLGAGVVFADQQEECAGTGTCGAQTDEASMMQLAGLSSRKQAPTTQFAGALHSKPFTTADGGLLKASEQGAITINEDGVMNTYYLPGATVIDDGMTVKYTPPYRFYLMKTPTTDYSNADAFYKPILPGKTFTVDMDFRKDGASCGCNLNYYLVDMPVSEPGKDKDYYCDAQCFPDMGCCSEYDMNEGNMNVQQITNHACTDDYAQHPDWACNKWGDPELKTHESDFSIGEGHTINSEKPYTFSQKFEMNGDDMTVTTTISQDGRDVVLRMGPGNSQLNAMAQVMLKGMAFVTGYWYDGAMNWMDGDECGQGEEHCSMNPAYISNWRITTNGEPVPTPPTPPPAPTPPTPPTPPPPSGSKCCYGSGCTGCNEDPNHWCNTGEAECTGSCGGSWC